MNNLVAEIDATFDRVHCTGLPLVRLKANTFLVGTQVLPLRIMSDDFDTKVVIDNEKKPLSECKLLESHLQMKMDQDVKTIVKAMEQTGYDFEKMVEHYCRVNGASDKVLETVDALLDEDAFENLRLYGQSPQ